MFETVAPEAFTRRSRRVFYQSLPASITLHGLVIAAGIAGFLARVEFPSQSPPLVRAYTLAEAPPPPPPPPPPAPKPQHPAQQPVQRVQLAQLVAPTVIPDTIPDFRNEPPPELPAPASTHGVEGGIQGGVEGGVGDATPVAPPPPPPAPPDHRLHVKLGVPLPMKSIRQEYPIYPEEARLRGYEDNLLVRYTVGRDGRVKDIVIVDAPYRKMFEDTVLHALRDWRFTPYIDGYGHPQEVVHDMSFNFQLR